MPKRILVLEPFSGASHATLYRGWEKYSEHEFTVLELPAVHWKWRSRHASLTFAEKAKSLVADGGTFDGVFCSDMLNLPEWRGLAGSQLSRLPAVAYFHENQFTYPIAEGQQRDYQYAYTNVLTAIAAEKICFNSEFHRQEFSSAAIHWLRRMPDYKHIDLLEAALEGSEILPVGIDPPDDDSVPTKCVPTQPFPTQPFPTQPFPTQPFPTQHSTKNRRTTIGWVARWEFDKRPDVFVAAIEQLMRRGAEFQLILLGQQFASQPDSLAHLIKIAGERVLHCGFAEDLATYWHWLKQMDVVVSTADHEFFGVGVMEAAYAGALPVLPNRLAYPEVFRHGGKQSDAVVFYKCFDELVDQLDRVLSAEPTPSTWRRELQQICWNQLYKRYDRCIEGVCQ